MTIPIAVDESKAEESAHLIADLLQEAEVDPLDAIAACVHVINELAQRAGDPETVLDWAAGRME